MDFETVLRAKDRDGVIGKQLNEVKYENVRGRLAATRSAGASRRNDDGCEIGRAHV